MNPGPVLRLDLDATVLRANRAAIAIFGQELNGSCWRDVLPTLREDVWSRIVEGGERVWVEIQKDDVHLGFTMMRSPESEQVFVYGTDITALKHAEQKLAELARFPEMNPGPVLRLDRDGEVLLANRAARELFGSEDLVGRSWQSLCGGVTEEFWTRVLASSVPLDHETRVAGSQMLFTHTYDDTASQVFVYGADLTDLKSAERLLRQSERMATLGTLAAGVAHELNNPAAAVQRAAEHLQGGLGALQRAQIDLGSESLEAGLVERLAELDREARTRASSPDDLDPLTRSDLEYDVELWLEDRGMEDGADLAPALASLGYGPARLDELAHSLPKERLVPVVSWMSQTYPVYEVLEEIRHGAHRISEIVTALKNYSYVGQAPLQTVDVNDGIRHTLIILRNKLKQGVEVDLKLDPELGSIRAYGGELNQVWTNLIDNAVDAMEGHGHLVLRTAKEEDGIRVEVEDNGPGIPEAIQGRIFDPFFTTKEPGQGTGLGLNTTYNTVVKKHGGHIELRSRPGRTLFIIQLPSAPSEDLPLEPGYDGLEPARGSEES
jgi:signal transduction histidine kinase